MNVPLRHAPSTVQRDDDDVEISSLGRGGRFGSGGLRRFRTLRATDKILETSMSRPTVPDNITQTDSPDASVQDVGGGTVFDEDAAIAFDDRARSVLSLLIRKEGREVLEGILSTDDPVVQQARLGQLLLSSHDVLHTFSRLVTEGGLAASDGCLRTTALTDRILKAITEKA